MTSKDNTKYASAVMMLLMTIITSIVVSQEVGTGSPHAARALCSSSRRGSQKKRCSRRVGQALLLPVHFGASPSQHTS